jgi:preprotein translocase subunit SecG
MGAALGGGAAETVFGGESANVLSKMTTTLTVILFVLSFGLYLGFVAREKPTVKALDAAATAPAPVTAPAVPAVPAAATTPAAQPQSTPAPTPAAPAKAAPAPVPAK